MKKFFIVFLTIVIEILSQKTSALEINPESGSPLEVHGFLSQGAIKTTSNNYLGKSEQGNFNFTEVGLNFSKSLTDRLSAGIQLFARNFGSIGNYNTKFDWFYLNYRYADWLGIRVGRTKIPFGLYNEVNDIDSARVWILLPQSLYPTENRDFLLAQNGAEIYGYHTFGSAGSLDYRVYGGNIFLDFTNIPGSAYRIKTLDSAYVVGSRILWETPLTGFKIGGSVQALRIDSDIVKLTDSNPVTGNNVSLKIPAVLWVASTEYINQKFQFSAEYSRWHLDSQSTNPTIFPESQAVSESAYGMFSYQFMDWFQPGFYYSIYYPDVDNRDGREKKQHDLAGTLRFDFNSFWLLKLEAHYMRGTARLNSTINDSRAISSLDRDWGLFLAKTTIHF